MIKDEMIEELAAQEHTRWSLWMEYFFSKCERSVLGILSIPIGYEEALRRQIYTPYDQLTEEEKQADRDEVMHVLPIIGSYTKEGSLPPLGPDRIIVKTGGGPASQESNNEAS